MDIASTARCVIVAAMLLGDGSTTGCSGRSNAPPAASASNAPPEDEAAAGLMEHHRYHHHGGATLFIAMSLDTLGVSPEQRAAIEKIRTDLRTQLEPARKAEQNLLALLADGLAASNLDAAKVDAAVAQVTAAAAAVEGASADALNELHAALTPPQRAALVDKVQAHWAVWQRVNGEQPGHPEADHLATAAADLDLTPAQIAAIRARLDEGMSSVPPLDPQEIVTRLQAFGEAFRSDKIDPGALASVGGANAHLVGRGAAHVARLVEAANPVLTPDQRARLVQRLRDHATHDPSSQGSP